MDYKFNNKFVMYLDYFRKNNFIIVDGIVESRLNSFQRTSLKNFNKYSNFLMNSEYSNAHLRFYDDELELGSKDEYDNVAGIYAL